MTEDVIYPYRGHGKLHPPVVRMKGVPGWSLLLTQVCNFLRESPGETPATIFQKLHVAQ